MKLLEFIRRCFCFEPIRRFKPTKFIDLAPVGSADETGAYFEALDYATNNPAVLNIALTGPYGSGKSSVIQSFVASYPGTPLQLSLASFFTNDKKDDDGKKPKDDKTTKQEIERSILQQILYGANTNQLPLSRFKRIQTPSKWSIVSSLFFAFGILSTWYLYNNQPALLSGEYFEPLAFSNWLNLLCFGAAALFWWVLVHSLYVKSLGLSLKSISLKDVQIAPAASDTESILNRHLDEIVYFFQSTKYDLVIIEDLDRFNDPDIFVTLREINALLNRNPGITRPIRFLYALRDDIFQSTERTKFFEFIVPVIPVINHSNSIDKVLEHSQRLALGTRLDPQFVRDVSRYLSDMRLIRNIFNEYVIYAANLKADDDLSPTKLLAVLIYKNVLPHDFAALHREDGALKGVLSRYDEYVAKIEAEIRVSIATVEAEKSNGEAQALRDHAELCKVYAMALIERAPAYNDRIYFNNEQIPFTRLAQHPSLQEILTKNTAAAIGINTGTSQFDISGLQASVDPTRSFAQRMTEIERKSVRFQENADRSLRELKGRLASVRIRKFNEVVRESAELIEEVFAEVGNGRDLLRFLILEGHLDDTYYQYTSLFHSGRLSPNDDKFLKQIRSYNSPGPDFQLDNIEEVIVEMRDADFGQRYVLNRHIIDELFRSPSKYTAEITAACSFISTHFRECEEFFSSYYVRGAHVGLLVERLIRDWTTFPEVALEGSNSASHSARILAHAPTNIIRARYAGGPLSQYVSANTNVVLNEGVPIFPERFAALGVRVSDLESIAQHGDVVIFLVEHSLYEISISNIRFVTDHVLSWPSPNDLETRHYSTMLEMNNDALLRLVEGDFQKYVQDVLLALETNTSEDISAVIAILNRDDVDEALQRDFVRMQRSVIPSFKDIPTHFHAQLLQEQLIEATWENALAYRLSDNYDAQILTTFIQSPDSYALLANRKIPGDDNALALRQFIYNNNELNEGVYRSYIRMLPNFFNDFPTVEQAKIKILIEELRIDFTPANVAHLHGSLDLQVLFVATNFDAYADDPNKFDINDEFRKELLRAPLVNEHKMRVILEMDPTFVIADPGTAALIGPVLDSATENPGHFDANSSML